MDPIWPKITGHHAQEKSDKDSYVDISFYDLSMQFLSASSIFFFIFNKVAQNCEHLQESISTCRFAQRVALIKNDAILNVELDPRVMIAKLKQEIANLKGELAMATGESRTDDLTDEDVDK